MISTYHIKVCNNVSPTVVDRAPRESDMTMFCDFTPQHVISGWSEMVLTSEVAQVTKEKGVNVSN